MYSAELDHCDSQPFNVMCNAIPVVVDRHCRSYTETLNFNNK